MKIEQATAEELVAYIGLSGWLVLVENRIVAISGFRRDTRLWGYLDVFDAVPTLRLLREMKRKMLEAGEDIYVMCDEANHKNAPRLLRLLGFAETDERIRDVRIWKWQTR